jgi:pimeloyl-ACP methyl ester carboxylesterase
MPTLRVTPDLDMHYSVDCFAPPWSQPETVLLLHGNSESGDAWYGWMPALVGRYRVVRPDMRGFGRSTAMPEAFPWSLERIVDDACALMDHLRIERFHLAGAKIGGTAALAFAIRRPDRVHTLTVAGAIASGAQSLGSVAQSWYEHLQTKGVESWARWTMPGRLGADFPAEGAEWWARMMGGTALSTQLGFMAMVPDIDLVPQLPSIRCPTLVLTSEGRGLGSHDAMRSWQERIPDSTLIAVPGRSYHVAATDPQRCAGAMTEFIGKHPVGTAGRP